MPLSRARDRARGRSRRAEAKRLRQAKGTAIFPKRIVRMLKAIGLNPERAHFASAVTLDAYKDLKRAYDAKVSRVEWQSGGIRMLYDEIATLQAKIETLLSIGQKDTADLRIMALEAEVALLQAELQADAVDLPTLEEQEAMRE